MKHSTLLRSLTIPFLVANLLFLTRCVVPYESARMLPKGNAEVKAAFTHVRESFEGENEKVNNGFGLGVGYGVSDRVNLKFRYERISLDEDFGLNYIAFGPKFAIKPDRIAALLPIGVYFDEGESTWGVHPTMLFGLTRPSPKFELTLGLRGDIFFEDESELLLATNLGFGFSEDLDRWAIRPDIGLVVNPGESGVIFTFGIGAQYNIAQGAKK